MWLPLLRSRRRRAFPEDHRQRAMTPSFGPEVSSERAPGPWPPDGSSRATLAPLRKGNVSPRRKPVRRCLEEKAVLHRFLQREHCSHWCLRGRANRKWRSRTRPSSDFRLEFGDYQLRHFQESLVRASLALHQASWARSVGCRAYSDCCRCCLMEPQLRSNLSDIEWAAEDLPVVAVELEVQQS